MPDEKKIVKCPDCEKDHDMATGGRCASCGLDLEYVFERYRTNKAIRKMEQADAEEAAKTKKTEPPAKREFRLKD